MDDEAEVDGIMEMEDDGHSSDDGFGFQRHQAQQTKKGNQQKVEKVDDPQDSELAKPEKRRKGDVAKAEKAEKAKKPDKLLVQGKTAATGIDAISPLMIWQGKAKDAEGKIQKAKAVIQSLENEGEAECVELANRLKDKVLGLEKNLELLTIDYNGRTAEELQKLDSSFMDRFCELPADCANAMVSDFGRALLEDSFARYIEPSL